MGFAKRQMEEGEERGWHSVGEKWVCADHVEDPVLRELIADNATSTSCSYCDEVSDDPFAAEADLLVERIGASVPLEWGNADDEAVPWEGEYVAKTLDSYDLVTEGLEWPLNDSQLIADVALALPEIAWVQRDFYRLSASERLRFGWREFGAIVKHRRRYFFADHEPEYGGEGDLDWVAPGAMLAAIGRALVEADELRELAAGTEVFRVRAHALSDQPGSAAELGAPPTEKIVSSSRMSAAGIPMLYAALDSDTAAAEARSTNPEAEAFTLGRFELLRPIRVVDLSVQPEVPSLFDPDRRELRPSLAFLRHFVEDIAAPFVHDDRIHIEYVPTQIVTEWLATRFSPAGGPVMGLLYRSSRSAAGVNAAIFTDDNGACDADGDREQALLVLKEATPLA